MFARIGAATVQVVTTDGPVTAVGQLVAVQPLPALAGIGVHEATGVGPTLVVAQVVVV